jgi:hypothetical protein
MNEVDALRAEFASVPSPSDAAVGAAREALLDQIARSTRRRRLPRRIVGVRRSPRALMWGFAVVVCLVPVALATPARSAIAHTWDAFVSSGDDHPPPVFEKLEHARFRVKDLPPGMSISARPQVTRIPDPGWSVTWALKRRPLTPDWIVSFRTFANAALATEYFDAELVGWRRSPPPGGHLVTLPARPGYRSWTLESVFYGREARRSCAAPRCVLLETDTLVGTLHVSTMTLTPGNSRRVHEHLTARALEFLHQVNTND